MKMRIKMKYQMYPTKNKINLQLLKMKHLSLRLRRSIKILKSFAVFVISLVAEYSVKVYVVDSFISFALKGFKTVRL
jgi:hypothetical protein